MLQSLFRPVLRPIMMGVMAVTGSRRAWSPLALWPDGIDSPGMWNSPSTLPASFNDSTGTTPVATPGTVADSANPVGLALDIRAGATTVSDPGNHMLQATSAARPLESARVNQYQYTEDPSNAVWTKDAVTYSSTSDPAGGNTGIRLSADAVAGSHAFVVAPGGIFWGAIRPGATYTLTFRVRANGISKAMLLGNVYNDTGHLSSTFDLATGEVHSFSNCAPNIKPIGNGWFEISVSGTANSNLGGPIGIYMLNDAWSSSFTGNGVDGIDIWHPQFEFGLTATPYQSIPTDGSTYPSTGFPIAQLYDGVDDGMATASFAAGTLINGMDCLIPVRRDSGANCVAGLYNGVSDATKFFGMAESASGSGCVGSGAGTPTVWVDNTQLTGGTAVTRGTLHTALTAGSYHILEFQDLDLSTWTATGFGLYTSYVFPGARGDIMLYPSTASTTDKDAARQYLADKYGVTLA